MSLTSSETSFAHLLPLVRQGLLLLRFASSREEIEVV